MKSKGLSEIQNYSLALFFAISISLLPSCEKDSYSKYGFDSDFGPHSSELTVMSISSQVSSIVLSGNIFMYLGEMKVECIDPDGYIVYNQSFFSSGNYVINETFKASRGIWTLRYTSLEGSANIDLHADF